ncbi:hypothetical protein BsWGS_02970 [Bradybaena similaris]
MRCNVRTYSQIILFYREPRIRRIPNTLQVTVVPGITRDKPACNTILPQATWGQKIPNGYMHQRTWHSRLCHFPKQNYKSCFQHKQVVIFGDSNARFHYHQIRQFSKCTDVKKALTEKWHKPLLCVHEKNNFSVSWNPHTNPFMHGKDLAPLDSLVATSKGIDEIPSHGEYLIIMHHYFHLTTSHISVFDALFRNIKDALARLFKRNTNVQVVLQGPHISWFGWPEHYAAGDMLGTTIMDLQRAIFHDIKDKVILVSPWDMTIATKNMQYHPSTAKEIFYTIAGYMCGR